MVSYCDPIPRTDEHGRIIKYGHKGTIYQASSAKLLGRSSARTLLLTRDGTVISERSLSKIRGEEQGAAYCYRQLLAAGAPERQWGESPIDYVRRAVTEGPFSRVKHPGNWVYGWACGNSTERRIVGRNLGPGLPYPKQPKQDAEIDALAALLM